MPCLQNRWLSKNESFCFLALECLALRFRWYLVSSNHFRIYLLIFRDNSKKAILKSGCKLQKPQDFPQYFPSLGRTSVTACVLRVTMAKNARIICSSVWSMECTASIVSSPAEARAGVVFLFWHCSRSGQTLLYRSWAVKGDRIGKLPILSVAVGELRCGRS